ncbi:MAG: hypothetical protein JNM27_03055 [Leptospirales bacterium]|nr:hypothetical protein [Leptospirales bacterium]
MTSPKEIKDSQGLTSYIHQADLEHPEPLLISGDDVETFDVAVAQIKTRILARHKDCLMPVFANEPDDDVRFVTEIENVPLFAPYRLIIVRDVQAVLSKTIKNSETREMLRHAAANLPDRTWIVMQYAGKPGAEFLSVWAEGLVHFATRDLFPEQIIEFLRTSSRKAGLHLSDEVLAEIRDRIIPRAGALEAAIQRIKANLPPGEKQASLEFVEEVLFPSPGWNISVLVDALFHRDPNRFFAEIAKRDPMEDFARPLKAILNRTDELRRARVALDQGLSDRDVMVLTGHATKHPFVQKKIIQRLRYECENFPHDRLLAIYRSLDGLFLAFRSGTNRDEQQILFLERLTVNFF